MLIELTRDIKQVDNRPTLKAGSRFDVVASAKVGPYIEDKPSFVTIFTGDGELVIFS